MMTSPYAVFLCCIAYPVGNSSTEIVYEALFLSVSIDYVKNLKVIVKIHYRVTQAGLN